MLVLSRNENQSVLFPNLDISVSVVSIRGKKVTLGFEAPKDIEILRGELERRIKEQSATTSAMDQHALRNRLNSVVIALHLVAKSTDRDSDEIDTVISNALRDLNELNSAIEPSNGEIAGQHRRGHPEKTDKPTALVVEDNDNERRLLAAYLRLSGYEVAEVPDGVDAIRYLEQNMVPDIILLDMNLPKLNGARTVSRIRQTPALKEVKVFGVSGSNRSSWKIPSGERGIDKWFQKPVNPEKIVRELDVLARG